MYDEESFATILLHMTQTSGIIHDLVLQVKNGEALNTTYSLTFGSTKPESVYYTILKVISDGVIDYNNPVELTFQYGGACISGPVLCPTPPASRVN